MNEETLNASGRIAEQSTEEISQEEVVQPQYNDGADDTGVSQEEVTNPPSVDEMSDEEFESYINSAQNGTINREVQAAHGADNKNADTGDAEDTADDSDTGDAAPAGSEEAKPFRVFGSREEYQGEIDRIMGERLKKNRESMNTLESLKQQALNFYGGDDGDNALSQLIEDLQSQNAEKKGVSVEDYNKQIQDSIDAEKYRSEQERISRQQEEIALIKSRWNKESEELKRIIPDFDFEKAMRNKTFYDAVVKGASVSTAYLVAANDHKNYAKPKRKPISQNGAAKGGGIGKVDRNIYAMSDTEFNNYIDNLKG